MVVGRALGDALSSDWRLLEAKGDQIFAGFTSIKPEVTF